MSMYTILDGSFQLVIGNAAYQAGARPQDDVKDSEWLANLLRHGLIRPSFVPASAGQSNGDA
jgi:transposase